MYDEIEGGGSSGSMSWFVATFAVGGRLTQLHV